MPLFINYAHSVEFPEGAELRRYPELEKFMTKHRCSTDDESNQTQHHVKYDINRIINAERMKQVIAQEKLDRLQVAEKCLCKTGAGRFDVLSKQVSFTSQRPNDGKLSLIETQQLATLAEKTGFRDWVGNFDWDTTGRLVIYDTENDSFVVGRVRGVQGYELPAHCKFNFVASLMVYQHCMVPEAQEWLSERLTELLDSKEGVSEVVILPSNSAYDINVDFEKVKEQLRAYANRSKNV